MALSEFEKRRQENIERNQRALREFQLKEAADLAFGDQVAKRDAKHTKTIGATTAKRRKQASEEPPKPRRIRNLRRHGMSEEDRMRLMLVDENGQQQEPGQQKQQQQQRSRDEARKEGELKLQEFIETGEWKQAIDVMQNLGDSKLSQADYFQPDAKLSDEKLSAIRSQFSNSMVADERDIKVVPERVTSIAMHPTTSKKVVIAGDKLGSLGIWDTSLPSDEGLIDFKFHTGSVATIQVNPSTPNKIYTGSYDGSIRSLDLQAEKSSEAFVYKWNIDAGISDFHLIDPNVLYYSTLTGHFGSHDMRVPLEKSKDPFVLSEKKIGGFSVNPLNSNMVATASLDRTMRIYDLRKPYQQYLIDESSEDGAEPFVRGAMLCGTYDSRLSVSATSWNSSNQIVCNGYDNTINVFDINAAFAKGQDNVELTPAYRLAHNCQTGRWVSILKARWQENPRDGAQKFVIGNMKRYADVFAGSGQQLAHLDADHLTAVPAVSQFHRTENWIAGGVASGKVFLWTPAEDSNNDQTEVKDEVEDEVKNEVKDEVKDEVKEEN